MITLLPPASSRPTLLRASLATGLLFLVAQPSARAEDIPIGELTAVSSTVHNGFEREKLPDGSLKPVRYIFGEGERDPGSIADSSLERLTFRQLAPVLSASLAKRGFLPSRDVKEIDQLIVVHWGRTTGWDSAGYGNTYGTLNQTSAALNATFPTLTPDMKPDANASPTRGLAGTPGAANQLDQMMLMLQIQDDARARANGRNASLLGYRETLRRTPTYWGNMVSSDREELIGELEDDRYYVILAAYDFRSAIKSRDRKILWITRFSLPAHGNDFDRATDRMAQAAAAYFGRASNGLRRERMPEGRATPGKLEVLDYQELTKSTK
ncbi:MAG: hypothetical protein HYV96_15095 [Opitutae bacterium]|nr:hypothetical protein [Opitutae bacterium]